MISTFVENPMEEEKLQESHVYKVYKALEKTGDYRKLSDADKKQLDSIFSELWHPETYKRGIYKVGGWQFNFSQWLKVYWVDTAHYGIQQYKSFNKSFLKRNAVTPSQILKIVEIKGNKAIEEEEEE